MILVLRKSSDFMKNAYHSLSQGDWHFEILILQNNFSDFPNPLCFLDLNKKEKALDFPGQWLFLQ